MAVTYTYGQLVDLIGRSLDSPEWNRWSGDRADFVGYLVMKGIARRVDGPTHPYGDWRGRDLYEVIDPVRFERAVEFWRAELCERLLLAIGSP